MWTEIRSGFVTWVTMSYIMVCSDVYPCSLRCPLAFSLTNHLWCCMRQVVNPQVLSAAGTATTGGPMDFASIATATALSAAIA